MPGARLLPSHYIITLLFKPITSDGEAADSNVEADVVCVRNFKMKKEKVVSQQQSANSVRVLATASVRR